MAFLHELGPVVGATNEDGKAGILATRCPIRVDSCKAPDRQSAIDADDQAAGPHGERPPGNRLA